jgi:Xaa-Pro aminopeptidase
VNPEKHARVVALLDARDLDALVLRTPGNVAWYSDGGRTYVTPETSVAVVVVRRDGAEVWTAVNEADRLRTEELLSLSDAEWHVLPWSASLDDALPSGPRIGGDADAEPLRRSLLPDEVERYRAVCRAAAEAMTDAALSLSPERTEHEAAAAVADEMYARGLDPVVLLVAGGSRVRVHRHPLPTGAPVGDRVMLVACARAHGLIANLTRFVSFAGPAGEYERLLAVEAAFLGATRPGVRVGDAYAAGAAAYGAHGFATDEAARHHQGGPTGYETRDYLATELSDAVIEEWQPFAWNPSVPGLKVEDTVVATPRGVEVLTVDPRWPATDVDGLPRPAMLRP